MISMLRQPLTLPRTNYKQKMRRHVTYAKQRDALDFAEVVNGRASMYGVVFGGANWALTGLTLTQQIGYLPFQLLGLMSCAIVLMSMNNAYDKLNDKQFEDWATRDTGRAFMLIFGLMTLAGMDFGPHYL